MAGPPNERQRRPQGCGADWRLGPDKVTFLWDRSTRGRTAWKAERKTPAWRRAPRGRRLPASGRRKSKSGRGLRDGRAGTSAARPRARARPPVLQSVDCTYLRSWRSRRRHSGTRSLCPNPRPDSLTAAVRRAPGPRHSHSGPSTPGRASQKVPGTVRQLAPEAARLPGVACAQGAHTLQHRGAGRGSRGKGGGPGPELRLEGTGRPLLPPLSAASAPWRPSRPGLPAPGTRGPLPLPPGLSVPIYRQSHGGYWTNVCLVAAHGKGFPDLH